MINKFEQTAKALGDKQRLRILKMLEGGELCVCQITAVLSLAPATVSKHLSLLKGAGLVTSSKRGRWVYYALPKKAGGAFARAALRELKKGLAEDDQIVRDAKALAKVCKTPLEKLCC